MFEELLSSYELRKEIVDYIGMECLDWNRPDINGKIIKKLPFTKQEWDKAIAKFSRPDREAMLDRWTHNYFFKIAFEEYMLTEEDGKLPKEDVEAITRPGEKLNDDELRTRWIETVMRELYEKFIFNKKPGDENLKFTNQIEELVAQFREEKEKSYNEVLVRGFLITKFYETSQFDKAIASASALIKDADAFVYENHIEILRITTRHMYMKALYEMGKRKDAYEIALQLDDLLEKYYKQFKDQDKPAYYWEIKNDITLTIRRNDDETGLKLYEKLVDRTRKANYIECGIVVGSILTNYAECLVSKYINSKNKKDFSPVYEAIKVCDEGLNIMGALIGCNNTDMNYFYCLLCIANAYSCLEYTEGNAKKLGPYVARAKTILEHIDLSIVEFEKYRKEIMWYFTDYLAQKQTGKGAKKVN